MYELVEAQARQALEQLQSLGWAVGPPLGRDEWRCAIRAQARRAQLRVRTGEARGATIGSDGQIRPWAATLEGYEAMRTRIGGLDLASFGTIAVSADDGRRDAGDPASRSHASGRPKM